MSTNEAVQLHYTRSYFCAEPPSSESIETVRRLQTALLGQIRGDAPTNIFFFFFFFHPVEKP